MSIRIIISVILSCSLVVAYSQRNQPALELVTLDKGFFRWKDFSFNEPWNKVKNTCYIEQIQLYRSEYQNYYCGHISDTTKSYTLNNNAYHEFNGFWFDQVILHISGSTTSQYNHNSLHFIKETNDPTQARLLYKKILQSFQLKYGNGNSNHLEKYKKEVADSMQPNSTYSYLNDLNPFSIVDATEWRGENNISLKLSLMPEVGLIILSVKEYLTKSLYIKSRNWFFESNYDERFTNTFKEFDNRKGYKGLKFGMLKSAAKNIVKFKDANIMKEYLVTTQDYRNWFYIPFDYCHLSFNKKGQLFDVTLTKNEYSNYDYEQFIKELIEMFGSPNKHKDRKGDFEYTIWRGKYITFFVMRSQDQSLYVDFNGVGLDDTLPTDKLY
jgi:hypothetical protein